MGLFMTIIDGTMVNVALPTMADDFGVPTTDIEWIAVGYLLTYAAVIPAAGWLGDRFGTKRVFTTALIAFVATSLACGLSQTLDQLIVFRVLQGVGAGLRHPGRRGDALPGVLDGGPGEGGDRRAERGGDRAGDRPDARRHPRRHGVVALDLPDQRTDRCGGDRAVVHLARGDEARSPRPIRPRRIRAVGSFGGDPALHAVDRTGEGVVLGLHRSRSPSVGIACLDRADRDRAADPQPDPDAPAVQGSPVPHGQHLGRAHLRRVLRDDLRAAALSPEPARLHRLPERPRPVAPGGRRVPRVEPARATALSQRSAPAA